MNCSVNEGLDLVRRAVFTGSGALILRALSNQVRSEERRSLNDAAKARGLFYGVAVGSDKLRSDILYAKTAREQAGLLVAEGETKRKTLQPAPDRFDFHGADQILAFARNNGQQMRGHTLAWYQGNPDWLVEALNQPSPPERLLTNYVRAVVGHFKDALTSWDVINEPISPDQDGPHGVRVDNVWFKAFGESHIDLAFHAARDADPQVPLYLNETNTEADARWSARIRAATLALIDRLIARNVPLDGFGMQAHLKAFRVGYSDEVISRFLDEIAARGLKIIITEFDIADIDGPEDQSQRDRATASLAKRFLDVVLSKPAVQGVVTWGITDRYSWLASLPQYRWPDNRFVRSLPFDENYRPTPMYEAMMAAFAHR